jgi:hypothetical protein
VPQGVENRAIFVDLRRAGPYFPVAVLTTNPAIVRHTADSQEQEMSWQQNPYGLDELNLMPRRSNPYDDRDPMEDYNSEDDEEEEDDYLDEDEEEEDYDEDDDDLEEEYDDDDLEEEDEDEEGDEDY